jgi:hypothetical protein
MAAEYSQGGPREVRSSEQSEEAQPLLRRCYGWPVDQNAHEAYVCFRPIADILLNVRFRPKADTMASAAHHMPRHSARYCCPAPRAMSC